MRRPFKGLSAGAGPLPRYDAVVIGAGVGGLTCANLLAEGGLRVLLVEQHYTAGGYCSTFRRQGYTFDAATHFYPLLGNPETITGRLLGRLGVATGWVKMDPVDRFHFPDGSTFTVPADFDEYRRKIDAEFPHEREALDAFFRSVRQAYLLGLLCYFRWRDLSLLETYRELTVRDALDLLFKDRKLKLLLTADSPHWGSPPGRTSYVFDSMLRLSYFLGNYYPRGGSQAFADELAQRFVERGGHVLLHTEVTAVRVRNGAATGVALRCLHGPARAEREVSAGLVVSNADLLHTLTDLIGPRHVAPEYLDGVRRMRGTYPCFLTYLGVRGVAEDVLRRAHGYYWDGWDADELGAGALKFKLFVPTLYEPAMAPPGCHTVIVQKAVEVDYANVLDWPAHKARLEGFVLDNLEAVVPGLLAKAEVRLSATAATSQRFTRNDGGAMLGWEMSPGQVGAGRPDVVGPLKNLFFVGHWTQPGGGITPVLVSAMRVAELALRGADRAESGLDMWGRLGQRAVPETAAAPVLAGV
jgi:phytoene dehydrogenase-like protein